MILLRYDPWAAVGLLNRPVPGSSSADQALIKRRTWKPLNSVIGAMLHWVEARTNIKRLLLRRWQTKLSEDAKIHTLCETRGAFLLYAYKETGFEAESSP